MSPGSALRLALVGGWLGLYGMHAAHHALPGFGLGERHDLAAMLAGHLDRTLTYEVALADGAGGVPRPIGSCETSLSRDDQRYRAETRLVLDHLGVAGVALLARRSYGGRAGRVVDLRVDQLLDEGFRLVSLEAEGHLLDLGGRLAGAIDHRGLSGTWRLDGSAAEPFLVAGISGDANQGLGLTTSLPAGLRAGDRFTTRMISLDAMRLLAERRLVPVQRQAVFSVEGSDTVDTRDGAMELLRVAMSVDARPYAVHWCDDQGLVYRSREAAGGMALDLVSVVGHDGQRRWPLAMPVPPRAGARP